MKKLFAVFLAFLISGCSGCASLKYRKAGWDPQGDAVAAATQRELRGTVEIWHHMHTLVPDLQSDKPKLLEKEYAAQGTGTVIAKRNGESLVLTAAHVCKPKETLPFQVTDEISVEVPVLGEMWDLYTINMDKLEAETIFRDDDTDVCIMRVIGDAGEVQPVADDYPPVGAPVEHVGSPHSVLGYHRAFVSDGRFCGLVPDPKKHEFHHAMISAAADHGSSGGAVFYRGRIVGTVWFVHEGFEDLSYMTLLSNVQAGIREAKKQWHPMPAKK